MFLYIHRPGVPSRIPFPQKSLDRLRNFVESENSRKHHWKHPADSNTIQQRQQYGNAHRDRFKNAVNKIIASNRCLSSGNSVDQEYSYPDDRSHRYNTIHPFRDSGNPNDYVNFNGTKNRTSIFQHDEMRGNVQNMYGRYSDEDQSRMKDPSYTMRTNTSSEGFAVRKQSGRCGCQIQ